MQVSGSTPNQFTPMERLASPESAAAFRGHILQKIGELDVDANRMTLRPKNAPTPNKFRKRGGFVLDDDLVDRFHEEIAEGGEINKVVKPGWLHVSRAVIVTFNPEGLIPPHYDKEHTRYTDERVFVNCGEGLSYLDLDGSLATMNPGDGFVLDNTEQRILHATATDPLPEFPRIAYREQYYYEK